MADTNAGKGNDKCRNSDQTDSRCDFDLEEGKGDADSQRINTGGDGQHEKFF